MDQDPRSNATGRSINKFSGYHVYSVNTLGGHFTLDVEPQRGRTQSDGKAMEAAAVVIKCFAVRSWVGGAAV